MEADFAIRELSDENFKPVIIRTPVVYGPKCKGNFPRLVKMAKYCRFLPKIRNERSMIYIDNLLEFIKLRIMNGEAGVFYPQNSEYMDTVSIIKEIRLLRGKKTTELRILNPFVKLASRFIGTINKIFGNKTYDKALSGDFAEYCKVSVKDSIRAAALSEL